MAAREQRITSTDQKSPAALAGVKPSQDARSASQNRRYFATGPYAGHVSALDSYRLIYEAITDELAGTSELLDVGNGGVFEYDVAAVGRIVALDLFFDQLPADAFPPNVTARRGDALDLAEPDRSYDTVLEAFVFHHLVGERPRDLIENVRAAIAEAHRVLEPGGRLLVPESCVPRAFFPVERLLFGPLKLVARTPLLRGHPPVLQLPLKLVVELISERFEVERQYRIPAGRWNSVLARRWPTLLTPSRPWMVVARKPA